MKQFEFIGDKRRAFIPRLFYFWHKLLKEYELEFDKHKLHDLPYWYIEPTNVGLLALAAKKAGGYPLVEYSTKKGHKAPRKGRVDLWVLDDMGNTFNFEAKQRWVSVHNKNDKKIAEMVNEKFNGAVKAVNDLIEKPDFSVALVFVVPYSTPKRDFDTASFREVILENRSIEADFRAIHFCREDIWRKAEDEDEGRYYPCIAVVGRYVKYK